jgi:predicted glycogen debranching enzyme
MITDPTRALQDIEPVVHSDPHLNREWLVTNGLGGYASGTVNGDLTRRYHGLLIAALPNPEGRFMMLNALAERFEVNGKTIAFFGPKELAPPGVDAMVPAEFKLEGGLPVWTCRFAGYTVERRLLLTHGQNTVHLIYRCVSGSGPLRLELRPAVNFRSHDAMVSLPLSEHFTLTDHETGYELSGGGDLPTLRFVCSPRSKFMLERRTIDGIIFAAEQNRGYDYVGSLFSPGYLCIDLEPQAGVALTATTESWEMMGTLSPHEAYSLEQQRRASLLQSADPCLRDGVGAELVLAADQFVIRPVGRTEDGVRARAAGDEVCTVIAGYHWFTDWGRDTMISLEGLTLTSGRRTEASWIIRTFAHYVKDGLIPNMFPEGEKGGLYHTADASLWFFHAVSRYLFFTGDSVTLRLVLPKLEEIAEAHLKGTDFGIHVDPTDGLLAQGAPGYQLTWMDAKVGDWVVTPRRGKAVEINALWYNALCYLAAWMEQVRGLGEGARYSHHAQRAKESFNRRFWCEEKRHLYDVVDGESGDDASCRPNQIFAFSLPNPVLNQERWRPVLDVATEKLLTPVGLRSLSPDDPNYKPRYDGDLRSRDAAYHQGSVWGWLIGPYIDAWLKVNPERPHDARKFLDDLGPHFSEACIGSISEIFDAEPPHTPRACIAQAWSVAEVLRCWEKTRTKD